MGHEEKLRQARLVFYKQDLDKIDRMLKEFLKLCTAKAAFLIDKDGHLVTKTGIEGSTSYDTDTISSLVAGSFAATKAMAKLLGEEEFSIMFHQGKKDNIQLSMIGDRTILAVIFDEKTTVGMVRLYAAEAAKKMLGIFKEIEERKDRGGEEQELGKDFGEAGKGKLDQLFGN